MVLLGAVKYLAMLVAVWAYYHVIRQHYGFMVLYKVKNRDLRPGQPPRPAVPGRHDGLSAVSPVLHSPSARNWGSPSISAAGAFPVGAGGGYGRGLRGPAMGAVARGRFRQRAQVSAIRRRDPAALADVRVHELAGRGAYRHHRAQPAISRAGLVPQPQPLWRRRRAKATAAFRGRCSRSLLDYVLVALVFSALYRVPGFHLGKVPIWPSDSSAASA